ncbi:MFS general substrate transporter [Aspergillus steynii IBT 23096]|uniref:MFS general substrate transporter n=1 Tax=Aspergillus steynii IBT 23096 TaxID=1392250 RepID=A0A2I2GCP1_9EURO|nr:MFS general substrate transporter [Aspergillus steynii IBT 23096]PLB50641.1 MFS general substrate transporter [Aspergillus steynii IBT 23096]
MKGDVETIEHVKPGPLQQLPLPIELASLDPEQIKALEKDLVKRLDCCLLPAVIILFLMNILDRRNNIANAKIAGLPTTLGISNTQYNTCLMIFYVGYIITQLPSNVIITKVKPSLYIGLVTAAWGLVSLCQAFTRNFAGLFICRIVLGLVEGPFLPGVFFLMSCWYKRSELPPRIAFLYGANMLASAFGGLIAAGIVARMEGKLGRPAWEWLFIIEGSMTIAIALLVIPFIPDYPGSTNRWWLTPNHQVLADWRLRNENAGIVDDDPESLLWGVKQAFLDPKLYMFIVLQMSLLTAQSFNNFFPSIVGTLGYNETITLLLTAPPYFFAFLCSLCISFHGARVNERGLHIAVPLAFALLGNLLAMFIRSLGARYFSMFLMTAGSYSPYNLVVSWLSSTLPRPKTKRAAAFAVVNLMGAGVAHFYTSYMFPDSQKPRYYAGGGVMSGACLVCACTAMAIKWHLKRENRRIERVEVEEGVVGGGAIQGGAVVAFRFVH